MQTRTPRRRIAATLAIALAMLVTALPAAASDQTPVVAVDDTYTIAPSAADLVFNPNANDSDPWDGHLITLIVAVGTPLGSLIWSDSGPSFAAQVTYTPPATDTVDQWTYTVADMWGFTDTGTITINVVTPNQPPVATDDTATTTQGAAVTANVLANDTDTDGTLDLASVSVTVNGSNGSAVAAGNGTVTYTPGPGYVGLDSYTYRVCDDDAACDTATVSVAVNSSPESAPPPAAVFPFVDVDVASIYKGDIAKLLAAGITNGTTASTYSPRIGMTRGQMASFMVRAGSLGPATKDFFTDDDGSFHENDTNSIAAAGVTLGCAPGRFCSSEIVTRGELASFLYRHLGLAPAVSDYFTDDSGSVHEEAINALTEAGIVQGYGLGLFGPNQSVTRQEMATFIVRAFGL